MMRPSRIFCLSIKIFTAENCKGRGSLPLINSIDPYFQSPVQAGHTSIAMATTVVTSKGYAPALPEGWSADKDFKAIAKLEAATQRAIEPVGPHFLAHARRARHKRTFSEDDRIQAQERAKNVEEEDDGEISEPEDPLMLQREAKDWKSQDHYKVLGLSKYRYKATEEQIKRAHRKKVLKHHPDKKAAAGRVDDDQFFKCIQKATEVLLDPVKRRQYDSVDEEADVDPPSKKQAQKGNFYKLWGAVFKAEARFSKIQPVPMFGNEKSTKEEVENFYNFWYSFDSWRTFEYLDEDVPDDNENRDQKRHMERKNANARKKKKVEDNARLRKLLDDCSAGDERIKRFRQEANAAKNKKRLEKEAAEKQAIEDAKKAKEEEEKKAKEAEAAAKVDREANKKAKEAAKNAVKKNKRVLKGSVKDANYFVSGDPSAATIDSVLGDVELVQGKMEPEDIAALAGKLSNLKVADEIKAVWADEVKRLSSAGKLSASDVKSFS
jgi:DnaJ homolog subfamily C member 2